MNSWFQNYISDSEAYLLPMVQEEYETRSGAPWRNPMIKMLKIRAPISNSTSTTPSSSIARGSRTVEHLVPGEPADVQHALPVGGLETAATGPTPSPNLVEAATINSAADVAPTTTMALATDIVGSQAIPVVQLVPVIQEVPIIEAAPVVKPVPVVEDVPIIPEATSMEIVLGGSVERPGVSDSAGGSRGTTPAQVN